MRPQSTIPSHNNSHNGKQGGGGPYDTTSELVTVLPGLDGRNVLVATPTPALTAAAARNERPLSNGSGNEFARMGSSRSMMMKGNDIYPGY